MSDNEEKDMNELLKAYEADKERRNVREDELQAAKDYLGVLLEEIESKNKELEEKKAEAGKLADALRKSENEKQAEIKANEEAKESNKYKSIWIGIAIIEFLVVIALIISLFVVYDNLKKEYGGDKDNPSVSGTENPDGTTGEVTPEPVTGKNIENLAEIAASLSGSLEEGYKCGAETVDGLEYLVFTSDDGFKVGYRNEYYLNDAAHKKTIFFEKGDKRVFEPYEYDFEINVETLCPKWCTMNGNKMAVLTDYTGYGRIPDHFRIVDVSDLTEYYGENEKTKETISKKIISLMKKAQFSELPSGLAEVPILFELETSKALYKYGLTDAGFSEIGYNDDSLNEKDVIDISSEFRLEYGEEGISWTTVVKLGRKYYLGELKGDFLLGQGSVVVGNVKFGAYANPNVEDPDMMGIILPLESIPERYVTINGYNSERYYIPINDKVAECSYDWDRLDTSDPNNWTYLDENGSKLSIRGIDVSKYQGTIDWKKVAAAGVEFAIIRLGYRGMNEGTLELDPVFEKNMEEAAAAGIKTGVYFFSQAITKEEAEEEADFVIRAVKKYNITYPVIFDTERVATYNARANGLSYEDRTDMCITFCDRIAAAGYTPMIYANTKYMIMGINLERLEKYDKWFAVYSDKITFPYDFQMLQYSESGSIPGIKGNVDLDISFVDYSKADDSNE
ncbi:MAG: hypothetical protein IKS98_06645 [Lachnospiraceae bacterium]|nr:hypothetical protein [Lachnospiraceae bacterium]